MKIGLWTLTLILSFGLALVIPASANAQSDDTMLHRQMLKLSADSMNRNLLRRTTHTAAAGCEDPYNLGPERVRTATVESVPDIDADQAEAEWLDEGGRTSVEGCYLTNVGSEPQNCYSAISGDSR